MCVGLGGGVGGGSCLSVCECACTCVCVRGVSVYSCISVKMENHSILHEGPSKMHVLRWTNQSAPRARLRAQRVRRTILNLVTSQYYKSMAVLTRIWRKRIGNQSLLCCYGPMDHVVPEGFFFFFFFFGVVSWQRRVERAAKKKKLIQKNLPLSLSLSLSLLPPRWSCGKGVLFDSGRPGFDSRCPRGRVWVFPSRIILVT